MTSRPALVVGLMSGTSLNGMEAALVRFGGPTRAELLGFSTIPYSADEREVILGAIASGGTRDLALLHGRIGELAALAVEAVLEQTRVRPSELDCIALHGQTVWHEPPAVSWQLGEPAGLAERFGVRVVNNFRARDVVAGGQGAPLVPIADMLLFGHPERPRVLLNIGGMANLTFVPRRAEDAGVFAFDTGPGMALIDAVARMVDPALPYDVDGRLASVGAVDRPLLEDLLSDPFFTADPPKSTGRERFGSLLAERIHRKAGGPDGVRTAMELTAQSIALSVARWIPRGTEVVASGGGSRHPTLYTRLQALLAECGSPLIRFDQLFFDGDAKEAVAFALLGYLTIHGQPGNIPGATGARGPRVLGQITPA
ncbi:MAG: anhydro-N-acetylmuramic acid kinase [Gemmatimonadota bacterium]|nr:anhydro-N-acetylmuramic acid kinase [Gemmatimonadota bacterium]